MSEWESIVLSPKNMQWVETDVYPTSASKHRTQPEVLEVCSSAIQALFLPPLVCFTHCSNQRAVSSAQLSSIQQTTETCGDTKQPFFSLVKTSLSEAIRVKSLDRFYECIANYKTPLTKDNMPHQEKKLFCRLNSNPLLMNTSHKFINLTSTK